MYLPFLPFLFHLGILVALAGIASSMLYRAIGYRLCSVVILCWADLVYTALVLSIFSKLSSTLLYFVVSIAMMAALCLALWWRGTKPQGFGTSSGLTEKPPAGFDRGVVVFGVATLAVAAVAAALICNSYFPNNFGLVGGICG